MEKRTKTPRRYRPEEMLGRKYKVASILNEGSSVIYEAVHKDTGRIVVVKQLDPALIGQPLAMEGMAERVSATAGSGCDHLVQILDMELCPEKPWPPIIVMERLNGETLEQRLSTHPRLELALGAQVIRQVLTGLRVYHKRGLAHGSVSPRSILLTRFADQRDFVKLLGPYPYPEGHKGSAAEDLMDAGGVLARCLLGRAFEGPPPHEELLPELRRIAGMEGVDESNVEILARICHLSMSGEYGSTDKMMADLASTELVQQENTGESISFDSALPPAAETILEDDVPPTILERPGGRTRAVMFEKDQAPTSENTARVSAHRIGLVMALVGLVLGISLTLGTQALLRAAKEERRPLFFTKEPSIYLSSPESSSYPSPLGRPLTFAIAYNSPPIKVREEMEEITTYLRERLKHKLDLVEVPHDEVASRLETNKLDLAVFSPYLYVLSREKHKKFILMATHLSDGALTYEGYVVTLESSPIYRIKDLKGKRFCFVNKTSTSGYLFPKAMILRQGLRLEDLAHVRFSGTHEAALEDLKNRRCDAAAVYASAYLDVVVNHGLALRIVATTERIPGDAYCANPSLPALFLERIRRALLVFEPQRDIHKRFLGSMHRITGFVMVNDRHYDPIRRMHQMLKGELGLPPVEPRHQGQ